MLVTLGVLCMWYVVCSLYFVCRMLRSTGDIGFAILVICTVIYESRDNDATILGWDWICILACLINFYKNSNFRFFVVVVVVAGNKTI